jgi:hypothetical protein
MTMSRNESHSPVVVAAAAAMLFLGCAPQLAVQRGGDVDEGGYTAARFADADSIRVAVVAPGVTHTVVHDGRGPWAIHVVEIDATRCLPALEARKPEGLLSARATTSALAAGAVVAINADFFRLPGGTPVGAQVTGGVPLIGPTDWPVFAVTPGAEWVQGLARMRGAVAAGRDSVGLVQLNRPSERFTAYPGTPAGVTLFTARADTVPADSAAHRVLLRILQGDERAGRAVVVASDSPAVRTALAGDLAMLLAYGDGRQWAARRTAGDTITWHALVVVLPGELPGQPAGAAGSGVQGAARAPGARGAGGVAAAELLGGFPMLLRDGADVLHEQVVRPEFGLARHPRTALGWTADQRRLFLVVVDGRQPPYSDGMSLPETTWVFRRLGAVQALNLDGGGSTALVIHERLVNRPSDREGERAVGNALVLTGCRQTRQAR